MSGAKVYLANMRDSLVIGQGVGKDIWLLGRWRWSFKSALINEILNRKTKAIVGVSEMTSPLMVGTIEVGFEQRSSKAAKLRG